MFKLMIVFNNKNNSMFYLIINRNENKLRNIEVFQILIRTRMRNIKEIIKWEMESWIDSLKQRDIEYFKIFRDDYIDPYTYLKEIIEIHNNRQEKRHEANKIKPICMIAIFYDRIDIIECIRRIGYDFNDDGGSYDVFLLATGILLSLLSYCYLCDKPEILNYLLSECHMHKSYPFVIRDACRVNSEEMLDFALSAYEPSDEELINGLNTIIPSRRRITSIFMKIFARISNINDHLGKINCPGYIPRETIDLFLEAGVNILTPQLLSRAEFDANYYLVELCLKQNIRPTWETVCILRLLSDEKLLDLYIKYDVDLSTINRDRNQELMEKTDKLEKLGLDVSAVHNHLYDHYVKCGTK